MENENKNHGLDLLKALRARAGRGGKVQMEMSELCRAAGLDEADVRESLADLEHGGFITTAIICYVAKAWR